MRLVTYLMQGRCPALFLALKIVNILAQVVNRILRLLNRSPPARFVSPSHDSVLFLANGSFLGIDFCADSAFLAVS